MNCSHVFKCADIAHCFIFLNPQMYSLSFAPLHSFFLPNSLQCPSSTAVLKRSIHLKHFYKSHCVQYKHGFVLVNVYQQYLTNSIFLRYASLQAFPTFTYTVCHWVVIYRVSQSKESIMRVVSMVVVLLNLTWLFINILLYLKYSKESTKSLYIMFKSTFVPTGAVSSWQTTNMPAGD